IEQRGLSAGMTMLGDNAGRKLHRHIIAGEGREFRAETFMQPVKRRTRELVFRHEIARVLAAFQGSVSRSSQTLTSLPAQGQSVARATRAMRNSEMLCFDVGQRMADRFGAVFELV